MKKILTTTALVGTTLLAGVNVSSAQVSITGQLDLSYKALQSDSNVINSYRGFGRESQINFGYKGKLNNGLGFNAGFSWEIDGNETTGNASWSENTYLDFVMDKTTFTVSADHIQNPDFEITNIAGGKADIDDVAAGIRGIETLASTAKTKDGNSAYQAYGFGLIQDFGVAKASVYYAPNRTAGLAGADHSGAETKATIEGSANSQWEVLVDGNFGITGARAFYYQGKSESETPGQAATSHDLEGQKYGLSYNFGQFTLAASKSKVTSTGNVDTTTNGLAAAYAINKDLTLNVIRSNTNGGGKAVTESLKGVNLGYNLGPITLNTWYVDSSDQGGTSGNDGKVFMLMTTTKF
jgi:hypothetical protein